MATPPGFVAASMQFKLTGLNRPAYITFGLDPTGTSTDAILTAIATAWGVAGSINSVMDNNVTNTLITVRYGQDGGEDLVDTRTVAVAGTVNATTLPANCALLVHKRTARGGRRGRGRMFIPWVVPEPDCDEAGNILASKLPTYATALETFRLNLSSGGNPMVVLHKPSEAGTEHPTAMGAPDPVLELRPDAIISTQRRRLGR